MRESTTSTMRVLIVGGGIGGLCLAHGLNKAGINVSVFERQTGNEENLAGYGLHIDRNGRRALRSCLPLADWTQLQSLFTSAGTQTFFRDTELQTLAVKNDAELSGKLSCEVERSGIGRLDLRDVLLHGLTNEESPIIQWNRVFTHFERLDNQRLRIHFQDGSCEEGDVLVGADGPNSKIREQYLPEIKRLDLGIIAIAGRYKLGEKDQVGLPVGIVDGSLNNIVPQGKGWMFVSTWTTKPIHSNSNQESERSVVWAYVVPQEDNLAQVELLTSLGLRDHVLQATERWSHALQRLIHDSDPSTIKCLPLRSMPPLSPWQSTNVTVLGDAIHNMTPMAGMGANTALRDAESLTRVLVDVAAGRLSLLDAIGTYETEMREYGNEAVALSRRNAENASKGGSLQRMFFRGLLRAAQASPAIMRATLGRPVVRSH